MNLDVRDAMVLAVLSIGTCSRCRLIGSVEISVVYAGKLFFLKFNLVEFFKRAPSFIKWLLKVHQTKEVQRPSRNAAGFNKMPNI